jgi:predicted metalloprotease
MQWMGRRESSNTEEGGSGGGGRGLFFGGGVIGVIAAVIYFFTGVDPSQLLNQVQQGNSQQSEQIDTQPGGSVKDTPQKRFAKVVLADTEDIWTKLFNDMGKTYVDPKMVFFTDGVSTACGEASSQSGPFYCPGDQKVYIDVSFFDELQNRFQAAGDFAQAYVIAHEVGHHVQDLLGVTAKMDQARSQVKRDGV